MKKIIPCTNIRQEGWRLIYLLRILAPLSVHEWRCSTSLFFYITSFQLCLHSNFIHPSFSKKYSIPHSYHMQHFLLSISCILVYLILVSRIPMNLTLQPQFSLSLSLSSLSLSIYLCHSLSHTPVFLSRILCYFPSNLLYTPIHSFPTIVRRNTCKTFGLRLWTRLRLILNLDNRVHN